MLGLASILAGLGIGAFLVSAQDNPACLSNCLLSNAITSACGTSYPQNLQCICGTQSVYNEVVSCLTQNCPSDELSIDKSAFQDVCTSYGSGGGGGGAGSPTSSFSDGSGGGPSPTNTNNGAGGGSGGGGTNTFPTNQPTNPFRKPGAAGRRADLLGNSGGFGFSTFVALAGAGTAAGVIAIAL